MRKIISRFFIKIIAISLVFLNFKNDAFAQFLPPTESTAGLPTQTFASLIVEISNWVIIILLFPLSFLLTIIFYIRYSLMKKKADHISKIKTKKAFKKAKIFSVISILLIILYIILKIVNN